jgi:hypothetical protein
LLGLQGQQQKLAHTAAATTNTTGRSIADGDIVSPTERTENAAIANDAAGCANASQSECSRWWAIRLCCFILLNAM